MRLVSISFLCLPLHHATRIFWLLCIHASLGIACLAQVVTPLQSFNGTDGSDAISPLAQGRDGILYGTAQQGGSHGMGTVYRITTSGTLTAVYNFCSKSSCADGANPSAALVLGTDGDFYGTTFAGGSNGPCGLFGCGTVFKITSGGSLTTLHKFCAVSGCADGANPYAGLVQGADGNFYGTTSTLGTGNGGTIFKITPGGTLTTVHTFTGADGDAPLGQLLLATDGNFYGTTSAGGTGDGTVFRMTPAGTVTTLYSFSGKDGSTPYGGVVQRGVNVGPNRGLWGTTTIGGLHGNGTIFTITLSGTLTTLLNFCSLKACADGADPVAALATDNQFGVWAVATSGGTADLGSIVLTTDDGGTFSIPHSFCATTACADGLQPQAALVEHTTGVMYGVTPNGAAGFGAVYTASVPTLPHVDPAFVKPVPPFGKVGDSIGILGQNLSGTSVVKFGSKKAKFRAVSGTFITATVPNGATSAFMTVVTPAKSFRSNQSFQVLP